MDGFHGIVVAAAVDLRFKMEPACFAQSNGLSDLLQNDRHELLSGKARRHAHKGQQVDLIEISFNLREGRGRIENHAELFSILFDKFDIFEYVLLHGVRLEGEDVRACGNAGLSNFIFWAVNHHMDVDRLSGIG